MKAKLEKIIWFALLFGSIGLGIPYFADRLDHREQPISQPPILSMEAIYLMHRQPISLPPPQADPIEELRVLEEKARRLAVTIPDSARRVALRDAAIILGK